jgi:hypothetical protein
MPRQEHILTVFVASPSDVAPERARLEEVVTELNQSWSRSLGIRLDLIRWETHAYPGFGVDAQEVINRQVPSDYDIFIGMMWHRFGTATSRAESGTEEEFLRAKAKWDCDHSALDLMIYFKDAPVVPSQIDTSQLSKVTGFRKSLGEGGGLYWSFQSSDDFANLVRIHLTHVVQKWQSKLLVAGGDTVSKSEITKPSLVTTPETADEEETGLLELSEEFEDKFQEAADVITRIGKATEAIGKKIEGHASRAQAATETGSVTRAAAKRLISKAAKDMNDYAAKLSREVPLLRGLMQVGLGSLSKAISLWPEFAHEHTNHDQVAEWVLAIQGVRKILSDAEGNIQGFLDSVNGLPRLTTDLNKAKRSLRTELQSLIELFRAQEQLLAQTEAASSSLLSKQG